MLYLTLGTSPSFGSVTRVLMVQIQPFYDFLDSLEGALSDGMLKSQIWNGPKYPILAI